MKLNFTLSEFNITRRPIPEDIADKILKYHILPMQTVRDEMGIKMKPSQRSGYRPKEWERGHGRTGNSQHTFSGKGAVDWTCENFKGNKDSFLNSIIKNTDYTRIAVYRTFIHCDHKPTKNGKRELYSSTSSSKWTFIKNV